jgi:DNA-binding GntR family transcriptional regulator
VTGITRLFGAKSKGRSRTVGGTLDRVTDMAAATSGELGALSLVEMVVSRLSREILSGRLEPGERLVEEQLTRQFGISRAPLREALRLLAQQGIVEHMPRRGARVAVLSDRDVRELYGLRDVLERYAVELAMPLAEGPALAALRAQLDALRAATEADARAAAADAHRAFHAAVVALAGNGQLTLAHESVLLKIQLYMAVNLRREAELAQPADGVRRHERLLAALTSGDTGTALAALATHGARSYLG